MRRRPPKFVLDTHLFIDAFRDAPVREALKAFHRSYAPFEYFSVIVGQELRAGIRRPQDLDALEHDVIDVYARSNRTLTPSADAWRRSGDVLAAMARGGGLEIPRISKAFGNDVLLALSCRENGCVLVTDNERDFRRIHRFVDFAFTRPWPAS